MQTKKSFWQRMGSLLVALGMVAGIVMPSLPVAWAAEPKPTAINITDPIVMTEGVDLGDVGEVDPVHGGRSFYGYNPFVMGPVFTVSYDDGSTQNYYYEQFAQLYRGEWPVQYTGQYTDTQQADGSYSTWKAGNTYQCQLTWSWSADEPAVTGSYTVQMQPNPVAGFTIDELRPLWGCEVQQMSGWDENLQQEVPYNGFSIRDAVMKMTLTLSDGTAKTFTRDPEQNNDIFYELENHLQQYCGTRIWIRENSDQGPANPWGPGVHPVVYELCGKQAAVNVEILPNPVAGFSVDAMRPMLDCEAVTMNQWDDTLGQDVQYQGYEVHDAVEQVTVTLADGTAKTFTSQDGDPVREMETYVRQTTGCDNVWFGWDNPQGPNNLWGVGTHAVDFHFAGYTAQASLTIEASPYTAAAVTTTQKYLVQDGEKLYGDQVGVDYGHLRFTLTTADGTTEYSGEDVVNGRPLCEWLRFDNQNNFVFPGIENGWGVGTYTCTGASIFGIPVTLELNVVCPTRTVSTAAEFKAAVEDPNVNEVFLAADIDLSDVGTVTVPSNKLNNHLWIDTCAWDLTGSTTLLHINTNVVVHIGSDHGKPSSNPDPEAETDFNSGSAPMFHVEGASALELTAGWFHNADKLLTDTTAGYVTLMGGMYDGRPNGSWRVPQLQQLEVAYVEEGTGVEWWHVAVMLELTMEGTLEDGGVMNDTDMPITTPGTYVRMTVTLKNCADAAMDKVDLWLYHMYESDPSVGYDTVEQLNWASDHNVSAKWNPNNGLTELSLNGLAAGQTATITLTGVLPEDKAGDILYFMADATVKKYNVDNDPDTTEDDYEWMGSRSAGVGAVVLKVSGDVESDLGGTGGSGSVGSTPNTQLVQNATTEEYLADETIAVMQALQAEEMEALVESGVMSAETADKLVEAVETHGVGVELTTTVALEPLTAEQVDQQTKSAMQVMAPDGQLHYFDLSLTLSANGTELGNLHQLTVELPVVITLPDQFRVGSWTFVVLREHNGEVEPLMTVNNGDGTLTVYTDRFSTYAIAAKAVTSGGQPGTPAPVAPGLPTSPNTGADSVLPAVLSVMSLVSLAGVVLLKKKQN